MKQQLIFLGCSLILASRAFCSDKFNCSVAKVTTHVDVPSARQLSENPYKASKESVFYTLHCPEEFKVWTTSEMSVRLLLEAKASGQKINVNYDEGEPTTNGVFRAYGIESPGVKP